MRAAEEEWGAACDQLERMAAALSTAEHAATAQHAAGQEAAGEHAAGQGAAGEHAAGQGAACASPPFSAEMEALLRERRITTSLLHSLPVRATAA